MLKIQEEYLGVLTQIKKEWLWRPKKKVLEKDYVDMYQGYFEYQNEEWIRRIPFFVTDYYFHVAHFINGSPYNLPLFITRRIAINYALAWEDYEITQFPWYVVENTEKDIERDPIIFIFKRYNGEIIGKFDGEGFFSEHDLPDYIPGRLQGKISKEEVKEVIELAKTIIKEKDYFIIVLK